MSIEERLLPASNGILYNLQKSIHEYYKAEPAFKSQWEKEFNFWYRAMMQYSPEIAGKYMETFNQFKKEFEDGFE